MVPWQVGFDLGRRAEQADSDDLANRFLVMPPTGCLELFLLPIHYRLWSPVTAEWTFPW